MLKRVSFALIGIVANATPGQLTMASDEGAIAGDRVPGKVTAVPGRVVDLRIDCAVGRGRGHPWVSIRGKRASDPATHVRLCDGRMTTR